MTHTEDAKKMDDCRAAFEKWWNNSDEWLCNRFSAEAIWQAAWKATKGE